jgi:ribokinase
MDTTAAGDAFCGALAHGLASGKSVIDAVCYANKAASIAITRMGAIPSLPRASEVK